jgi:hypothetical protein
MVVGDLAYKLADGEVAVGGDSPELVPKAFLDADRRLVAVNDDGTLGDWLEIHRDCLLLRGGRRDRFTFLVAGLAGLDGATTFGLGG